MKPTSIAGFSWDRTNAAKLEDHGLEPEEIEELFDRNPVVFCHPEHPHRWLALGFVPGPEDRFVPVSFELDPETRWARVVTAFEPTAERWWRIYAKAKGIKT
jgi:uncharacterized DUF497 family protein